MRPPGARGNFLRGQRRGDRERRGLIWAKAAEKDRRANLRGPNRRPHKGSAGKGSKALDRLALADAELMLELLDVVSRFNRSGAPHGPTISS
jgi:hypothetical protein